MQILGLRVQRREERRRGVDADSLHLDSLAAWRGLGQALRRAMNIIVPCNVRTLKLESLVLGHEFTI